MSLPIILFPHRELVALAKLVRELRAVQKASGTGYKTTAAGTNAKALEAQVDAQLTTILGALS